MPAGTGRIAVPLAKSGVKVWCVEPSPAMRREFEKKLGVYSDIAGRIRLLAGDSASFEVGRGFPMAFLSGCFDQFLDEAERTESLMNIRRHLAPGGILLFDVFLGWIGNRPLSPAGEVEVDGQVMRRYVGSEILSIDRQRVNLIYEVFEGEEMVDRIEENGLVGIIDRQEVHRIVHSCGFWVVREWGGYDFSPYEEGDPLLVVEAVWEA
jgi:SAM-dependent methyltransferase